jgi:succinate dehydrogenase/fumarate reductase flavoprotein subunit
MSDEEATSNPPEDNTDKRISRRRFLHGTALGGLAAATSGWLGAACGGLEEEPVGDDINWDETTDVAVIGFGGAGAAAAIDAHDAGADVVIVEASDLPGGSTALSGQAIYGCNTRVQGDMGVDDSVQGMLDYYKETCDGNEAIMEAICEASGDNINWLLDMGMEVPRETAMPGLTMGGVEEEVADVTPPVPRVHWSDSSGSGGLWTVLKNEVDSRKITTHMETPAEKLLTDDNDRVVGIQVQKGGKAHRIQARGGVVIAAGGFSRNDEMMDEMVTDQDLTPFTTPTDTGDGIRMAQRVGAGMAYVDGLLDVPTWKNPQVPNSFLISCEFLPGQPPFLVVNKEGKRFMDESIYYEYSNPKILDQPDAVGYVITTEVGKQSIATEDIHQADTIEGLADKLGIDSAATKSTVEGWNANVEEGEDTDFGRDVLLKKLDEGPFYGAATYPGFAATMGGIKIDTDARVVDPFGQPFDGLYAAGCGAAMLGRFYPACGSMIAAVIWSGRVSGQNAAAQA